MATINDAGLLFLPAQVEENKNNISTILSTYVTTTQLATKQDTLVSGTNIKTINGQTILGSGNISIAGGTTSYRHNITAVFKYGSYSINCDFVLITSDASGYTDDTQELVEAFEEAGCVVGNFYDGSNNYVGLVGCFTVPEVQAVLINVVTTAFRTGLFAIDSITTDTVTPV